jgi:uncharacterized protein YcfL
MKLAVLIIFGSFIITGCSSNGNNGSSTELTSISNKKDCVASVQNSRYKCLTNVSYKNNAEISHEKWVKRSEQLQQQRLRK